MILCECLLEVWRLWEPELNCLFKLNRSFQRKVPNKSKDKTSSLKTKGSKVLDVNYLGSPNKYKDLESFEKLNFSKEKVTKIGSDLKRERTWARESIRYLLNIRQDPEECVQKSILLLFYSALVW